MWTGGTSGWLGNFPNPVEIAGAVDDCLSKAHEQGLHGNVYMAGHSLGGIMLETWIEDNPDRAAGFYCGIIIRREPLALQTMFFKVSFFLDRTFLTCLAPTRTSSKCLFSPLSESWTVSPSLLCSGCPCSLDQTGRRDFLLESFFDREWKESQEAEDLIGMPGRFPVHVINDANHGQV